MRLFERRFLIVGGKGGVGKSTITAALALLAARAGLKVLVCELDRGGRLSRIVNGHGGIPRDVSKNLTYLYVDPEAAMEEYLKIYLRIRQLYKPIANSPIMNYFLQAAPGFRELLLIGKIWYEVQLEEGRPRRHRWDMVIVDAPATGHGISFMGVAHAVRGMVRIGPIHSQTERMVETLQDRRVTALVPVSLPEEMPVNETAHLVQRTRDELGIPIGPVIMNCMPQQVFPPELMNQWREMRDGVESSAEKSTELSVMVELAGMGLRRHEMALEYLRKLREKLPDLDVADIPQLPRWEWNYDTLDRVAARLRGSLDL